MGPFTIDTYLPSFPAMGRDFGVSPVLIQQTLTAYLVPFSVMMLFHGALSDALGRRPIILIGVAGYVLASIGCALAPSLGVLLACRAMQGLVAGAGTVISRALIRDAYEGHEAQRLMSQVMMIFAIAPGIAPVIGGWLQSWMGWRANFWFLSLFSIVLFLVCYWYLPETHPPEARQRFSPKPLLAAYRLVAFNQRFWLLALVNSCIFAGFFLYVLNAPTFIYQHLKLAEHDFVWIFMSGVIGMMVGSFLSGRLAGRLSPKHTVSVAFIIMLLAALYNNLYYVWFEPQLPWSVLHQIVYAMGMSMGMPSMTLMGSAAAAAVAAAVAEAGKSSSSGSLKVRGLSAHAGSRSSHPSTQSSRGVLASRPSHASSNMAAEPNTAIRPAPSAHHAAPGRQAGGAGAHAGGVGVSSA